MPKNEKAGRNFENYKLGYLYDFVKRSPRFVEEPRYYGYGNGGYLSDNAKRAPRNPFYKKYRYGFGSDGYLYDFVKK